MAGYNQNPFTVDAGNNYSAGLSGLSNTIENVRQAKMQQAQQEMQQKQMQMKQDQYDRANQRFQEVQSAAQEAFASQDPDKVAQIAIKYPEVTQMLQQATGLKEDMQKKEMSGFLRELNAAPPDQRDAIYQRRIQAVTDRGGDPSHSIQSYEDYKANPEGEIRNTRMLLAGADPVAYNALVNDEKAAQKQKNEDRTYGLEGQKMNQQMTIAQMNSGDRALSRQISLLNAQQAATMNDLKKQELQLKIDSKVQQQQQLQQNKQQAAESTAATFDQAIDSTTRLLNHPALKQTFGPVGRSSVIPTLPGGDSANFEAELETLKAQTFLPQVAALKGTGALSDAEGKKLSDSVGALSTKMSQTEFENSLKRVQKTLSDAKTRALKNVPKAPVQASAPAAQAPASSGGWEIVN